LQRYLVVEAERCLMREAARKTPKKSHPFNFNY
jgi:hypothetical protein